MVNVVCRKYVISIILGVFLSFPCFADDTKAKQLELQQKVDAHNAEAFEKALDRPSFHLIYEETKEKTNAPVLRREIVKKNQFMYVQVSGADSPALVVFSLKGRFADIDLSRYDSRCYLSISDDWRDAKLDSASLTFFYEIVQYNGWGDTQVTQWNKIDTQNKDYRIFQFIQQKNPDYLQYYKVDPATGFIHESSNGYFKTVLINEELAPEIETSFFLDKITKCDQDFKHSEKVGKNFSRAASIIVSAVLLGISGLVCFWEWKLIPFLLVQLFLPSHTFSGWWGILYQFLVAPLVLILTLWMAYKSKRCKQFNAKLVYLSLVFLVLLLLTVDDSESRYSSHYGMQELFGYSESIRQFLFFFESHGLSVSNFSFPFLIIFLVLLIMAAVRKSKE